MALCGRPLKTLHWISVDACECLPPLDGARPTSLDVLGGQVLLRPLASRVLPRPEPILT